MSVIEYRCLYFKKPFDPEAIGSYRPFSCLNCHLLLEPHSHFAKYRLPSCLILFVIGGIGCVSFGLGWYAGIVIGVAGSLLFTVFGFKIIDHFWERPLVLTGHSLRTYPENLPPLADLLDEIAAADAWCGEFDKRLHAVKSRKTYDDWLENIAIESAECYGAVLQGFPPVKLRKAKGELQLGRMA